MSNTNIIDTVDFESAMDFSKEVSSSKPTRFERKRREQAALKMRKHSSAPAKSSGTPGRKRARSVSSSVLVS